MNYEETLNYIHAVQWAGHKPGLTRTRTLLAALGNPHKQLKFIHVAGTNGKGSTAAMLASCLLTMLALLTAMSIVFARVLSISTGFVRFNLGSLPTLLAAVLFGPVEGFAVGAVADMIGGTLSGYAINPLITLGAGSIGLTAGLLWRALPNLRLGLRTQISVFAGHAVGSIVINSLALHLFYNYPWSVLVTRIPNALVLAAVNTVLVRLLLENKTIRGIAQ